MRKIVLAAFVAILAIALAATLIPFAPTVAQAAVDTAALQLVATGNQQHNTSAQDAAEKLHALGLISELYQFLLDNMGGEVEAPEMFGERIYLDAPDYYIMNREISFMESAGLEGTVIQEYVLYSWLDAGYPNVSLPRGQWLIHDATHDKWYRLAKDIFSGDLERIYERGDWVEIFNNIA